MVKYYETYNKKKLNGNNDTVMKNNTIQISYLINLLSNKTQRMVNQNYGMHNDSTLVYYQRQNVSRNLTNFHYQCMYKFQN